MRQILLVLSVVLFAIAAILGFLVDDIDLRDVLAVSFSGLAAYAAASLVP